MQHLVADRYEARTGSELSFDAFRDTPLSVGNCRSVGLVGSHRSTCRLRKTVAHSTDRWDLL